MQEFQIRLRSVKEVQDFVDTVTACPYTVTIRDARNKVNGKSFMELFCLDFSRSLQMLADCGETEGHSLEARIDQFLVK